MPHLMSYQEEYILESLTLHLKSMYDLYKICQTFPTIPALRLQDGKI